MAVYKVNQDIEAEDKLLGPLTLKGFIYAAIAALLAFINFRLLFAGALGPLRWLFVLLFLFPMFLFMVLASPLGREQPTEVWLLSRVRFLIKPKRRIWDQSGISQLVTITAPKKIERVLTKGFSQTEVKSRLQALATTLDSHGWAVKNVSVDLGANPNYLEKPENTSDRLVNARVVPQNAPVVDVHPADDILDEQNNPTAQKFDKLIKEAETERKNGLFDRLKSVVEHGSKGDKKEDKKPVKKSWTLDADTQTAITSHRQMMAEKKHEDPKLNERLSKARSAFKSEYVQEAEEANKTSVTAKSQAVNMELAQSGNDLSVASIQHLAGHQSRVRQNGPNDVTISLH